MVEAIDDMELSQVIGVCDNGVGAWVTTNLQFINNQWLGTCNEVAERFFIQLVDHAGNVTLTEWSIPGVAPLPPDEPTLLSPENGVIVTDTTPIFQWVNQPEAIEYHLQIDDDPDFSSPVIDMSGLTAIYTPTFTLADGVYFWRVQSRGNIGNWSNWSVVWQVTIRGIKAIYIPLIIKNP